MAERKARFATLASLAEKHGDTPSSSSTTKGKERQRDDAAPTSTSNDYNNNSRYGTLEGSKKRENDRNRKFWKGIVRPTASSRHSGYECFSFADVLGNTDELESALLTTFCGEPEWIHSQFPSSTNIVLVMPCSKDGNFLEIQVAPNMKLINPKRERAGRGVMHIKLMLLYYKTSLRVAVSTANFIQYDWSTIENAVYVDDFPKQPEPTEVLPSPAFLETLLSAHRSLGTPQAYYKTALLDYDYDSAEKRVRLVLSVPGTHTGSRALFENGGHLSMCKALNDLDLVTPFKGANLSLECQGSFIGSYTSEWMKSFNRSALGWYPTKNSAVKHEESARKKYAYYTTSGEWPDDVKIVYPTFKTVKQSLGGPGGGGTIFCPLDTWKKPTFPRQLFYDSRSQRAGLLQHTKMILGIVKPADPPPATPFSVKKDDKDASEPIKPFGWLYIGSHNFTPAAWGRYSEKSGSLSLPNHELGVVIPLRGDDVEAQASTLVTWKRPLAKYEEDDTPWDQFKYGK